MRAWLVGKLIKRTSTAERNKIVIHILDSLQASPLNDIISVNDDGELTVNNRSLDIEKGRQLRTAADAALRNQALNLIREQVKYIAFVGAATKAQLPEDLLFYRAALWWGQEIERFLKLLAQRQEPDL